MRSSSLVLIGSILGLCFTASCGAGTTTTSAAGTGSDSTGPGGPGGTGGQVNSSGTSTGGAANTTTGTNAGGAGGALPTTTSSGGTGGAPCTEGAITCDGNVQKVCDANGGSTATDCAATGLVCVPALGCLVCVPGGGGSCNGNVGTYCLGDGSATTTETCDPLQGTTCNATTGHCDGACGPKVLGKSYIGCDYYPTVTANVVGTQFNFAAAVSNTTANAAVVTVTQGATTVSSVTVAANSVQVIKLPWQLALKGPASTALIFPASLKVAQGAYRLRSTQPVVVYQFSPLEYTTGGNCTTNPNACSYTNDASLLLPTNAWTGTYRVASRHHFFSSVGFYAVTASADNTTVTVAAGPTGGLVKAGVTGIATNGNGQVVLNAGDVFEIVTSGNDSIPNNPSDVTGTLISADKPVQVIGGHQCTNVPDDKAACDHLEESMFPYESLANDYIVAAPLIPTGGNTPKVELVRIVSTQPNTTLTYDPPQAGAPAAIAVAGGWVELASTSKDFKVSANRPIMVVQYMEGQEAGGNSGDPAMAQAVATTQFRKSYLFHAPTNYEKSYVNIIAPTGATVNLDGAAVAGFTAIGGTGYSVARKNLSNAGTGNHTADSTEGFGISVYGYGQYTSYWYPGGSDLTVLHE